jgi:hypothetical protein
MPPEGQPAKGIVHVPSKYTVPDTLQRLESVVTSHGLTVFARIDFGRVKSRVRVPFETFSNKWTLTLLFLLFLCPKVREPVLSPAGEA